PRPYISGGGFFRVESCPAQIVLPLVGLAAENVIRDRNSLHGPGVLRPPSRPAERYRLRRRLMPGTTCFRDHQSFQASLL
ncbi:MAG: hypothetical protein R6U98_05720, partial [Pirellulaceae bacterium]